MNILSETTTTLTSTGIPIQTGAFRGVAPETYIVLVPLSDDFPLSADNSPILDQQELRISLYSKNNYTQIKNVMVGLLLEAMFTITDRRYNGYDPDTGYHQYTIDIAKTYEMEEIT